MDMDKEMRPSSRGASSCGNRSLNSTMNLNGTNTSNFNPNIPGTPHEVNVLRFDDEDDNSDGIDRPDLNSMQISRKLSISELRKMNNDDSNDNKVENINNIMRENNQNENKRTISLQRRSESESRNNDKENKENEVQKRRLPPTLPSQKRKNKLEPLKQKGENSMLDNNDIFKEEGNGFDLSFSEMKNNTNNNNKVKDALDFLF